MKSKSPNRLTMEDIAKEVGVSTITVSRALAGSQSVKQKTREKIQAVAKARGYQFNVAARNLRLQRSHTIAVVIEMPPTIERPMSEPYPLSLLGGIIQELSLRGYGAMLVTADNFMRFPSSVEAVILLGQGQHDDAVAVIERCNLPLVVWGSVRSDANHITVGSDNVTGGALAAERFSDLGRRKAAFLGDTQYAESADRLDGFEARFNALGGTLVETIACPFTIDGGAHAMEQILQRHGGEIDAVFCASDLIAMGAVRVLAKHNISVPDNVSVIGFDDSAGASLFVPPLTTIRQDWHKGGKLLAQKALGSAENGTAKSETMPVQIIVRKS